MWICEKSVVDVCLVKMIECGILLLWFVKGYNAYIIILCQFLGNHGCYSLYPADTENAINYKADFFHISTKKPYYVDKSTKYFGLFQILSYICTKISINMAKEYDYLIVGAGVYGATFACMAHRQGKRCLVIDKRNHLGGNIYCENIEGINVHKYGAHIFHTSNKKVWDFANSIVEFNRYTNSPIANYKGKQYNLPFNMNTFYQMWGVLTPAEAQAKIDEQRV